MKVKLERGECAALDREGGFPGRRSSKRNNASRSSRKLETETQFDISWAWRPVPRSVEPIPRLLVLPGSSCSSCFPLCFEGDRMYVLRGFGWACLWGNDRNVLYLRMSIFINHSRWFMLILTLLHSIVSYSYDGDVRFYNIWYGNDLHDDSNVVIGYIVYKIILFVNHMFKKKS